MTEGSGKEKKHAAKESKRKNSSKHSSESTDLNGGYKEPPKDRKYFLKYPQAVWHIQASELPELDSKELEKDEKRILALKTESKQLYNKLAHEYEENRSKKSQSDDAWMSAVTRSGTMSDKMAAMVLQVQGAPLYRLRTLHSILDLAFKPGRRENTSAMDTMKDLLLTNLLPDRKLVAFHNQPLSAKNLTDMHKVYWYFEDELKSLYGDFVNALSRASHDSVAHTKKKAVTTAASLLSNKPEQEQHLLSLIVNKLGDPEKQVASAAAYQLELLLQRHRGMKLVVVREVESFIHRKSVSLRGQYYGVVFLNTLRLSTEDSSGLLSKLIGIYFSLFKRLIEGSKNIDSKMLSALLSGVNRAFPFAPVDRDQFSEHLDTLFKITHVASFNKATQALQLIFQVLFAQGEVSDRFYRVLYEKVLDPELATSSKQGLFLNVLYKALKHDPSIPRLVSFVKRILQVALHQNSSFACGTLLLISEVLKHKAELVTLFNDAPQVSDELKQVASKVVEQISTQMEQDRLSPAQRIAKTLPGASVVPNAKGMIVFQGKERITAKKTVPTETSAESTQASAPKASTTTTATPAAANGEFIISEVRVDRYDPRAREPLFAHSENAPLWELVCLAHHVHPSVRRWATLILSKQSIEYSGDPLVDFGLQSFLDRIVGKKPKEISEEEAAKVRRLSELKVAIPIERLAPITEENMLGRDAEHVPEDQLFFHRFFQQRDELYPNRKKKRSDSDDELSDDGFEMDEEDMIDDFEQFGSDGPEISDDELEGEIDENDINMDVDDSDVDAEVLDEDEDELSGDELDDEDVIVDDELGKDIDNFSDSFDDEEVTNLLLKELKQPKNKKKQVESDDEEEEVAPKKYSYDDLEDEDFEDEMGSSDDSEAMDSFLTTIAQDSDDEEDEDGKANGEPEDNTDFMTEKQSKGQKRHAKEASVAARRSVFADVGEFQHMLETSGQENTWESKRSKAGNDSRKSGAGKPNLKKRKVPSGGHRAGSAAKRTKK